MLALVAMALVVSLFAHTFVTFGLANYPCGERGVSSVQFGWFRTSVTCRAPAWMPEASARQASVAGQTH